MLYKGLRFAMGAVLENDGHVPMAEAAETTAAIYGGF